MRMRSCQARTDETVPAAASYRRRAVPTNRGTTRDMTTDPIPHDHCTVTVCRGCHCGTSTVVPQLDHAAQLDELRGRLDGMASVRTVDCLDLCERANVIVIQPSPTGRRVGGRPAWLGQVNDPEAAAQVVAWIRDGGPGQAGQPDALARYALRPPRKKSGR
jgi:predicted metal-binding protein